MKTGDTVLHKPTGEHWTIAWAERGRVCPVGWPETLAEDSDCELLQEGTEAERMKLLHDMANIPAPSRGRGYDSRRTYARRVLGLAEPPAAQAAKEKP